MLNGQLLGKSNVVSGIAKAIKAHFEKHPLAIVNVKGRAKGTSVKEVVFKLEVCKQVCCFVCIWIKSLENVV